MSCGAGVLGREFWGGSPGAGVCGRGLGVGVWRWGFGGRGWPMKMTTIILTSSHVIWKYAIVLFLTKRAKDVKVNAIPKTHASDSPKLVKKFH